MIIISEQVPVVKRGPGRPKKIRSEAELRTKEKAGEIASIVKNALTDYKLEPCKTLEEMKLRIDKYFQKCVDYEELPTLEGLALVLGVTRGAFIDWEAGKYAPEKGPIIAKAKELIAAVDAQLVATGKMPPIPYIFRAKNYYGMSDKTEIDLKATSDRLEDENELKKAIEESIVLDEQEFEDVK